MKLIDVGVNLTHESFAADLPQVLERAAAAGVGTMIVTGTSIAATEAALQLHEQHPVQLYATAGIHPHHAADLDAAALAQLTALARRPGIVAIGECGLDYFRNYSPRAAQLQAFRQQLELAVTTGLPVFLHQRDAHDDFIAVLRDYRPQLTDAIAHCFTGAARELDDCLALELAIGMTGWICDERRGEHLKQLVGRIPLHRLMLETDAPYLLPRSLKPKPAGRRNEPAWLTEIANTVAVARGESVETLAAGTTAAAEAFFRLKRLD
ncbi:MAG TPA: TatD family hydrolase [Steroidobacteraceae bacterium]|nr:TatD family hydrolase [Steroidobacteraceae bacterium]